MEYSRAARDYVEVRYTPDPYLADQYEAAVKGHRLAMSRYANHRGLLSQQRDKVYSARHALKASLENYNKEVAKGDLLRDEVMEIVRDLEKVGRIHA